MLSVLKKFAAAPVKSAPRLQLKFFASQPSSAPKTENSAPPKAAESKKEQKASIDFERLSLSEKLNEAWKQSKPRVITIGLLSGAAIVVLSGLTGVWHIIEFFAELNFINVGAFAYVAGFASAAVVAASYFYLRSKFVMLRPDRILSFVLKRVQSDSNVLRIYGPDVSSCHFQAYAYPCKETARTISLSALFTKKSTASAAEVATAAAQTASHAAVSTAVSVAHTATRIAAAASVPGAAAAAASTGAAAAAVSASSAAAAVAAGEPNRGLVTRINDFLYSHKVLQVLFEIRGILGRGYVSAEVSLEGGMPKFESLTVTHAETYERLLLEGEPRPPLAAVFDNPSLLHAVLREPAAK